MAQKISKRIFFPAKDKSLARKISIRTPGEFNKSIEKLKMGGITLKEKKALTLARTRAKVQLRRPNLSIRERKQFLTIATMPLPKVTKRTK